MKHYLIYRDGQSSRLWQLEKKENSLTVSYGESQANLSSLIATFENESQCADTTELLVGEKLKKGYKFMHSDTVTA